MRPIERELANAGLPDVGRTAWVEVETTLLVSNARILADLVAPSELGVVVKADGYGHGLEVAARCAVHGGATWLCVATLPEALRLRSDGYRGRVFVLYPIPSGAVDLAARQMIDVSVSTRADVTDISEAPGLAVHLEVDTGMTRGGCPPTEVDDLVDRIRSSRAELKGIWTHLATPEDRRATAIQVETFGQIVAGLDGDIEMRHLAASGGILAADLTGQTLVRAGLVYYGHDPDVGVALPTGLKPALEVRAHPIRIASVPAGTGVGYSSTWRATRSSRIATIPMGYADGWSRSLSPGADVLVGGRRAPLVGRVSSDAITVDVTEIPGVDAGTVVCLMGSQDGSTITADEVAAGRGTISWEVLQQLGSRLPRIYRHEGDVVAMRPESNSRVSYVPGNILPYSDVG